MPRNRDQRGCSTGPAGRAIECPKTWRPGEFTATLDDLLAQLAARPSADREQKRLRGAKHLRSRERLGAAQYLYPDYTVSGGYFNQGTIAANVAVPVDVKLPAYFRTKNRAEIAEKAFFKHRRRHNYEGREVANPIADPRTYTLAAPRAS